MSNTFPIGNAAKYYIYKQINQFVKAKKEKLTIVDMGCGNGSQFDWLYNDQNLKNKVHYYGFDLDVSAINQAKQNKPDWSFFAESETDLTCFSVNSFNIPSLADKA